MLIHRPLWASLGACLMLWTLGATPGAAEPESPGPVLPVAAEAEVGVEVEGHAPVADAAAEAEAPSPPVFVPFDTGRRWYYVYVRERTRTVAGGAPQVEKLRGTLISEITGPAPKLGASVVRMQSSLTGKLEGEATPKVETTTAYYRSQGTSYQLVAEEVKDPAAGSNNLTTYLEPLRLLESQVAVGHRWTVGVRQQGQLQTDLQGEILGVQDVQTPKGVFERCLVVRLTGKIHGVVEAYGSRTEVPDGRYEATEWYAPGVGRVLAKIEMVQKLVFEDGKTLDYVERTQFALRSMEDGRSSVPASSEPATH